MLCSVSVVTVIDRVAMSVLVGIVQLGTASSVPIPANQINFHSTGTNYLQKFMDCLAIASWRDGNLIGN